VADGAGVEVIDQRSGSPPAVSLRRKWSPCARPERSRTARERRARSSRSEKRTGRRRSAARLETDDALARCARASCSSSRAIRGPRSATPQVAQDM